MIRFRDDQGRIVPLPEATRASELAQASAIYAGYLTAVCKHQGIAPAEAARQFSRPGIPVKDLAWRRAIYARQLALYLAHTEHSVRQSALAIAAGMTRPAVLYAIAAIEDLRDIQSFDLRVDIVAAEMGVPEQASGTRAVANGTKERARA